MRSANGLFGKRVSRRDAIREVAGATLGALALASLPASGARTAAAAGVADQGKSVTMALASEPNTFDPHLTVGRNTQIFIANVFDGLTARDASANILPALATEWGFLGDGSSWQFKLRQGVTFHNGDPFNAESVKFTIERAINPDTKSTISSELATIAGVDVVDASTVVRADEAAGHHDPEPAGRAVRRRCSRRATRAATDAATLATKPNGTGPFMLTEWAKNERLVLQANPSYWRGPASVSQITVRPILEDAARVAALQTGEVDFIATCRTSGSPSCQADPNLVVKTVATPRVFFVGIEPARHAVRQRPGAPGAELRRGRRRDHLGALPRPRDAPGDGRPDGGVRLRRQRHAVPVRSGEGEGAAGRRPATRTASRSSSTRSRAASPTTRGRPRRSSSTCDRSASTSS